MTNQVSIRLLNQIRHMLLNSNSWLPETHNPINEAFDMAISALQAQDLQSTCNNLATDTISRQATIDAINNIMPTKEGLYEPSEVLYKLMQLPYVQPEIIRCKNCKWWSNDDYRECSNPNYDDGYITPAGFYCGYAERRTDERTD